VRGSDAAGINRRAVFPSQPCVRGAPCVSPPSPLPPASAHLGQLHAVERAGVAVPQHPQTVLQQPPRLALVHARPPPAHPPPTHGRWVCRAGRRNGIATCAHIPPFLPHRRHTPVADEWQGHGQPIPRGGVAVLECGAQVIHVPQEPDAWTDGWMDTHTQGGGGVSLWLQAAVAACGVRERTVSWGA
jgi:hypothetical protein